MKTIPTVRVVADGNPGYRIINEEDFDKGSHVIYDETGEDDNEEGEGLREVAGFDLTSVLSERAAEAAVAAQLGTALAIHRATDEDLIKVEGIGKRLAESLRVEASRFVENTDSSE